MDKKNIKRTKLEQAKRRVEQIKGFYNHVLIFIVINGILLLSKDEMTVAIFGKEALGDSRLMNWIDINVYIWLGILVIHGLIVFSGFHSFVKKWEKRQLERYLQKEEVKKYE